MQVKKRVQMLVLKREKLVDRFMIIVNMVKVKKSLEETSNDNTQDCESMETEDTNYVPDERGDEFKKVTRILVKRTIVIVNNSKAVRNLQHHFILSVNITHI